MSLEKKKEESLALFMKKNISEKANKKTQLESDKQHNSLKLDSSEQKSDDELTVEEKELEEAKKLSRNKASERDRSEMFKKLLIENIVKYFALICVLVIFTIGIIKFAPSILSFFNGLISRLVIGAFSSH